MRVLLPEIKKAVKIPVIGAGGVMNGQDIVDVFKLGADGVQMGTRFAASEESNAAPALKEFYLKAKCAAHTLGDRSCLPYFMKLS